MNALIKIAGDLHDKYQMHLRDAQDAIEDLALDGFEHDEDYDPDHMELKVRDAVEEHDHHLRKAYLLHGRIVQKMGLPEDYDHHAHKADLQDAYATLKYARGYNPNSTWNKLKYSATSLFSREKAERDKAARAANIAILVDSAHRIIDQHEGNVKLFESA